MNLVKLYNAKDELEANIIADMLKNAGIPCHIQDAGAGEYLNIYYGFTVYGKDIYVEEQNLDEAKSLIEDFKTSTPDNDITDDISEDSDDLNAHIPWYYKKNLLVRAMFLMPVVLFVIFLIISIINF